MLAGEFGHRFHIYALAVEVYRDHGPIFASGCLGVRFLQIRWSHQSSGGIDIGENHLGADIAGGVGGGEEGQRRDYY
jgi:hypothetical protein